MKHADPLDFATALQEAEIDNAINNRVRYEGLSLDECVECGDTIPLARREAVQGCTMCVTCQTKKEKR